MLNSLPALVINIIIDRFLSYEDTMNLRLTCKDLKRIVDDKKFKNVFIFHQCYPYPHRLFYTNESIGYSNSLRVDNLRILNESLQFKQTFKYIQKLIFYDLQMRFVFEKNSIFNLEQFNYFEHLEHLEMHEVEELNGKLFLQKLKHGFFHTKSKCDFELDCEQLKAIHLKELAKPKLTIKTTNSLNCLSIRLFHGLDRLDFYHDYTDYLLELIKDCKNLSILCIKDFEKLNFVIDEMNEKKLNLPMLKEIRIEKTENFTTIEHLIENLLLLDNMIKIYLNDRLMLIDDLIEISKLFNSERMQNSEELNLCLRYPSHPKVISTKINPKWILEEDYLYFIDENPLFADCLLPSVWLLSIKDTEKLNENFVSKLANLWILKFKNQTKLDDKIFDQLLNTCRNKLSSIFLESYQITEDQYNRMPNYFENKIRIVLRKEAKLKNFDFLNKFKNIYYLDFSFNIERDDLTKLLKEGNHSIKNILFRGKFNEEIWICTNVKTNSFKIVILNQSKPPMEIEFDNFDSLINYYYSKNLFDSDHSLIDLKRLSTKNRIKMSCNLS